MRILVIVADCILVNSSANLCHLAYLEGLSNAGHQVDLLCADSKHLRVDSNMRIPQNICCKMYPGRSLYQWLSIKTNRNSGHQTAPVTSDSSETKKESCLHAIIRAVKKGFLASYGVYGIYATFVRKAMAFHKDSKYDYVLSLSWPPASHFLAYRLLTRGHIFAKHWIQIWEDPWYSDAYGFGCGEKIRKEERQLLTFADKVCYVSPLTLENQQKLYPGSAGKMFWQPLPFYYKLSKADETVFLHNCYGYFGDYVPAVRNLEPFYKAAKKMGIEVNVCGNPDSLFASTENIHIHPRLPLNELKPIEDITNVLIFLCNRKGGQIPGKIYQYSATNKIILFIMDGTQEEQQVLKEYFAQFNRYIFCQNTVEDITRAIHQIESGNFGNVHNVPLDDFAPVKTITNILEMGR